MTHLYTDTSEPDSPMWLFHLPTFTLAQLHLNGGPGASHLLIVAADEFAPDEALTSFAATLEAMASGASNRLSTICRADIALGLPEILRFSPEKAIPDHKFLTLAPRHGFAQVRTTEGAQSYWRDGFCKKTAQADSIQRSVNASDEEFMRRLPPSSL